MRTLRCYVKTSIAIILCIVLVFSAMCVYAQAENKETRNTQFFAVFKTVASGSGQASSSLKKSKHTLVCWINPFEPAPSEDAILCAGVYNIKGSVPVCGKVLPAEAKISPCQKDIEYFMRI